MTIHPVVAQYFRVYGGTNMVKLIVAFRDFVKAPKKSPLFSFFLSFCKCVCMLLCSGFRGLNGPSLFSFVPIGVGYFV